MTPPTKEITRSSSTNSVLIVDQEKELGIYSVFFVKILYFEGTKQLMRGSSL